MAYYTSHYYNDPYAHDSCAGYYDPPPTQSYDSFFSYASPSPYYYADYGVSSDSIISYSFSASNATSQSVVEFNEAEFEEYDPTPYGGGYDIVETYGKPLPPSDKTCYPRFPAHPTPVKHEIKVEEAREEIRPPAAAPERPQGRTVDSVPEAPAILDDITRPEQGGDDKGYYNPFAWDGYGKQGGYGYGYESSEFGYCSCWCHGHGEGGCCRESQPNWSATYIFGCSGYPYGQGREAGGNYPNPIFGYEMHYEEQPLQGQVHYEEPSLLNVSSYFH